MSDSLTVVLLKSDQKIWRTSPTPENLVDITTQSLLKKKISGNQTKTEHSVSKVHLHLELNAIWGPIWGPLNSYKGRNQEPSRFYSDDKDEQKELLVLGVAMAEKGIWVVNW